MANDDGVTAFCSEENMMMSVYLLFSILPADDTQCDGKESVYISRPLSPSLVVLILSRVIQTRVFTKQKFIYICVNVCVCVCVSFLDARAQQGKDEEKRAKNENLKKEGLLLFSSFFVSLSLGVFFSS